MPNIFQTYDFFAHYKKYYFYKNNSYFLGYVFLTQKVKIKDKQITIVKN